MEKQVDHQPAHQSPTVGDLTPKKSLQQFKRVHFTQIERVTFIAPITDETTIGTTTSTLTDSSTTNDLTPRSNRSTRQRRVLTLSTPSQPFEPTSTYPFPHFHIPTKQEIWEANRQEAAARKANETETTQSATRKPSTTTRKRKSSLVATTASPTTDRLSRRASTSTTNETTSRGDEAHDDGQSASSIIESNSTDLLTETQEIDEEDEIEADGDEGDGLDASMEDVDPEVNLDDSNNNDMNDEDDDATSKSSYEPVVKRRGRPKGSRNRPKDPDEALEFDLERDDEVTQPSTERLTSRQRAMQTGESGEQLELLSLPNRPSKSKSTMELTEEQLARKQAANERRKINEKERMEKEKLETIQKLLMNTPAKRVASASDRGLGAIPPAAKVRRGRPKKGAAAAPDEDDDGGMGGEDGDEDGMDGGEVMEDEAGDTASMTLEKKRPTITYSRNKVVWRNYLIVDDANSNKRMKLEEKDGSDEKSTSDLGEISASYIPPTAQYCFSVSFPVSAPLPPPPLFSFDTNLTHLIAYQTRLQQRNATTHPEGEESNNTANNETSETQIMNDEEEDMAKNTSKEPAPSTTSSSHVSSSSSAHHPHHRPICSRSGCGTIRRYTDAATRLPICSLTCLKQLTTATA